MDNTEWPFGPELKQHRQVAGLSQREAARHAGISESKWRQLESGRIATGPGQTASIGTRPETAAAAARAVNMSVRSAIELIGHDPAEWGHLINRADDPVDDVVPGFSRLTTRQRGYLIGLVQAILETDEEPTGVRPGVAPPDIASRGRVLGRADDRAGTGQADNA